MTSGQKAASGGIAILGGTFDPVHFGHLRAAVEAGEKLGLEDLRLVPASVPPHRPQPVASAAQRLDMLRLAVENCPILRVDDRELQRPGSSFMVDTLEELRDEFADSALLLLIGQDAANALDTWHRWQKLFELAHLVVMRRPDAQFNCSEELAVQFEARRIDRVEVLGDSTSGCVLPLEITQLDISATLIRDLFATGRSPRFLMPDNVIDYVYQQRLYGAD